jgi:hypothetical protein
MELFFDTSCIPTLTKTNYSEFVTGHLSRKKMFFISTQEIRESKILVTGNTPNTVEQPDVIVGIKEDNKSIPIAYIRYTGIYDILYVEYIDWSKEDISFVLLVLRIIIEFGSSHWKKIIFYVRGKTDNETVINWYRLMGFEYDDQLARELFEQKKNNQQTGMETFEDFINNFMYPMVFNVSHKFTKHIVHDQSVYVFERNYKPVGRHYKRNFRFMNESYLNTYM